jgi:hypothetical protein
MAVEIDAHRVAIDDWNHDQTRRSRLDDRADVTWRCVDGVAAGTSHLASETPCQDRCRVTTLANGAVAVAVLSDGAGSAAYAEDGADAVCDVLLREIAADVAREPDLAAIDDDTVRGWFCAARARLAALAAAAGTDVREFSATALVCVAGEAHTICAQVGDGGIVVRDGGAPEVAVWPAGGEYANQTYFVTDDDVRDRVETRRFARVDDVAVFSDGLTRLALAEATRTAFQPFFDPLVRTVRTSAQSDAALRAELTAYLGSESINTRTDDDKALVVACRTSERFSA